MRTCWLVLALTAAMGASAAAQAPVPVPAAQAPGAATPAAATSERVFGAPAGLILNAVRPTATADFEMVLARLAEALRTSADPVRRRQAAGWRVFRAAEPGPDGSVLYVFVVDPVVPGADYGVARVLAEAFPGEAGALYALYAGAFLGGQTLLNLQPVEGFVPVPLPPAGRGGR